MLLTSILILRLIKVRAFQQHHFVFIVYLR